MSNRNPRALLLRLAIPAVLLGAGGAAAALSIPTTAAAALPASFTQCSGKFSNDPGGKSSGEPNLLDYDFSCSTGITAYTLIISRINDDGNNIDDFSPNANVVYPTPYAIDPADAGTVSNTESINCGGAIPSDGINCFVTNGTAEVQLGVGDSAQGTVDPTNQYCSYLPKGAKPGTPAVPRAILEVVVTDSSGAQDGPFELTKTKSCAKVAAVVPTPKKKPKPKPKPKKKKK